MRLGYPESRLAKLFNGSIPIVLDSLKQHYFIDRDGGMFRHILNFMRNSRLLIPENFSDLDLLLEEARYFDIAPMCRQLEQMKKERLKNSGSSINTKIAAAGRGTGDSENHQQHQQQSYHQQREGYECAALHISPDLGERIMLSAERALLEKVFPETNEALLDPRSGVPWNQHDDGHVIRFPLNGYCKLNSVQAITRLLNAGFRVAASNGGGVEGQQFSEYLFVRRVFPV
ncbi:BTB/POZ domain-containing protein kctd15 isoform X2 [Zootermopsis nevadensis]|uniref:BTB/POZ domain-containing protein kctd15 isoform X2 n=1 Tax=Zootermopsis nevadensis TaxID=136037 RepID=UPI000B8E59DE|nr:BTB/POZ domain-containing protein kctd15 isoform X2 [Zootermopsis nevadensis]